MRRPQTLLVMDDESFDLQLGPDQLARLATLAQVGDPVRVADLDAVPDRLAEAEVLLTSWGARVTSAHLDAAPRLRAVLHAAGSLRGVLDESAWERGLLVTTAAGENARPVAEYTLAAIVLAGKRVWAMADRARTGDWSLGAERARLGNRGRTIGVVGFSRTGRRVVELLRVLETAHVLVADPVADPAHVRAAGAQHVPLDELLARSDVVTLHAPSLPSTRHLIGAAQLAAMRDGATLVNTARGALVDTAALEAECARGRLDAVLDVAEPEPLPAGSVLYRLPNVLVTPHVAGALGDETRRLADRALDELERYASGRPPIDPVTREELAVTA